MKDINLTSNENIEKLSKAFQKAEETLKDQELLGRGLLIPAVNQLRYVASHLIRTLGQDNQNQIDDNLRKAIGHCHRAIFDSLEVQVRYYLSECDAFVEQFKDVAIVPDVPSYLDDKTIVDSIRIELSSMMCAGDKRHEYWKKMEQHLSKLKEINTKWNQARSELIKKVEAWNRDRENERQAQRRFIIQCIIGIIAILTTLVVGGLALLGKA